MSQNVDAAFAFAIAAAAAAVGVALVSPTNVPNADSTGGYNAPLVSTPSRGDVARPATAIVTAPRGTAQATGARSRP